ncbi:MAG: ABC transporter permease [Chlamydiota bacterium]|nr:ABC transporter permease [Chlamydiota bacterium]
MKKRFFQVMFYISILLGWEILFRLHIWPDYIFPSPKAVLTTLVRGIADTSLLYAIAISMRRVLMGYSFSLIVGILLGMLLSRYRIVEDTLGSLLVGVQTLPSICWLPIALLWFGLNEKAIIFVVIMGAVLAITIATQSGIKQINPLIIKAARNMGAHGWRLSFEVVLPAALPSIVTGMKQGWSFAWRALMSAELLFVSVGLGHLLMVGRELHDMSQVAAVMLTIVLIGWTVDAFIFSKLERIVRRKWGLEK